jgi:hypothetical protein
MEVVLVPTGEGWEVPEGISPWSTFHWFRVSPRQSLKCVVLSQQPVWYAGHYDQGRMRPCKAPHCSYCEDNVGRQVRFVFAIAEVDTHRMGLIEVSQSVAELIRSWTRECEGLRGMVLEFFKHSNSIRSRTQVALLRDHHPMWYQDLEAPDPKMALEMTWQKAGHSHPRQASRVPRG